MEKKIALRIGTKGRVSIPLPALQKRGINEGDIVLLTVEKANVTEVNEDGRGRA